MAKPKVRKKIASKIAPRVEARIVGLSVQNPEFGAKRLLPLLNLEGIDVSASTVYHILRRNGLSSSEKRLAKLTEQSRKKRGSAPRKVSAKITDDVAERIAQASLQNPNYGARRLVFLLANEKIQVAASAVYSVLRRNGLGSSEKRLAKLAEQSRKKHTPAAKEKPTRITDEVAERIVQVSLQNPDFGARRLLPLLEKDGILVTAASAYTLLKRNGLQNRGKRLARIKEQQTVEALARQDNEIPPPGAVPAPASAEQPEPVSEHIEEKVLPPWVLPASSIPHKATAGKPWFLTLIDIVLLFLIVFLGFHAWQNVGHARLEPEIIAAISPGTAFAATKPEAAPPPLSDFRMISERNLFNVTKEEDPGPKKAIAVEKLPPAKKELGLQLVGTVVAYDSWLSRAFIDNRKTRKQEAYREGDRVGDVLIKKVLRNKVIIATKEGDRLLTVAIESSGKNLKTSSAGPQIPRSSTLRSQSRSVSSGARTRHISLDRQEVEDSLANIDQLLQELTISPYMQFQKPAGFRISNLSPDSIFSKMGLSSRDVIVGINDQKITSPDQAAEFLQALAEGDEVTIRAKRRRRTRRIILNFE